MKFNSNTTLKKNSQNLRKNMTPQERKLWYKFLRTLPYTVLRQHVVGNYIVDFYCDKTKTVIEIDGSQHYENDGIADDVVRDEYLRSLGLRVLRYSNREININFDAVCNDILYKFGLIDGLI